jgi:hypothetical protein
VGFGVDVGAGDEQPPRMRALTSKTTSRVVSLFMNLPPIVILLY